MKIRKIVFIIFLALFGVGILFTIIYYLTAPERYNFLVIGSDQRGDERARSDVLMLISIPKSFRKPVSITTIPRDSLIEHPQYGMQKITHFYALGERTEGKLLGNVVLTQSVVSELLDIKIHGTFEVTFEGFKNIVDYFNGVDTSYGHLNGEEALAVVRDRYRPGGDFARTTDQREIFESLASKVRSYSAFKHIYAYIQLHDFSRIRWSKWQVGHFAVAFVLGHLWTRSIGEIHEEALPGAGDYVYTPAFGKELYYWVLDDAGVQAIIEKYLH